MPHDPQSEQLWREAWASLPLPTLAQRLGDTWQRSADPCPSCGKKHKFKIFQRGTRWYFNCFNSECLLHAPEGPRDEIGYLAVRRGLARKEAALEYLRLSVPHLLRENTPAPAPEPERHVDAMREESINTHHAVWKRLKLLDRDLHAIASKRGFTRDTVERCGLRSNGEHNRDLLESLPDEYGIGTLVAEGVYKHELHREPRLAGQLVGWGRTGRKDDKGKEIWEQNNPVLIPYFDLNGLPYYVRPHKGGLKRPEDPFVTLSPDELDLEEDDEERPCASYVYVPPGTRELVAENDGLCILTEGEFKAIACFQARVPCIATPGTSFLKNANFRRRMQQVLEELGVSDLVIIYDNEVKDDPSFPNYKEDPHDRYDVQVWAEYAHHVLSPMLGRSGSCRIGWLGSEWREAGKADFDSILAKCVRADGPLAGTNRARRCFLQAVAESRAPSDFLDLFADSAQRIIQWKVKQKRHRWRLATGGSKEMELALRFGQHDGDRIIDYELSSAYRDVIGCYYTRESCTKEERVRLLKALNGSKDSPGLIERIDALKGSVTDPGEPRMRILLTKRDAIYERLRGIPKKLSTFTLRCDYRLHGHDGKVIRLVRIMDSKDLKARDQALLRIDGAALAGLKNFREWLLDSGGGTWHGGEKDLQDLTEDMDHQAFMRDIHEIVRFGYDKTTGIWFFGDAAKGPDGEDIYPDDKGIYWHNGFGYQIDASEDERGATGFAQKMPYLKRPHGLEKPLASLELDQRGGIPGIFRTLAQDLYDNIGGYDGWLALGLILGYGIAPELLKMDGGGHPGLWVFGKLGEGKTTLINWLLRVWGFPSFEGIALNHVLTDNALQRVLSQYSSLPVFLDEARRDTLTETKQSILRGAFQRQIPAKATADYTIKVRGIQPFTTPIVGGESSSHDAATRSRFGQINVSASRRIGDAGARKARVSTDAFHYYRIADWLLSHRKQFASAALHYLEAWIGNPEVKRCIPDDRPRFVHGVAYACMQAAVVMLGLETDDQCFTASPEAIDVDPRVRSVAGFYDFLLTYGAQALQDTRDETFIAKFWEEIRAGVVAKQIPKSLFSTYHMTKLPNGGWSMRQGTPFRVPEGSIPALCIEIDDVFPRYEEQHRKRTGQPVPLSLADIRRTLEKEAYWIRPGTDKDPRTCHRPTTGTRHLKLWALSLAQVPRPDASAKEEEHETEFLFPAAEGLLAAIHTTDDDQG